MAAWRRYSISAILLGFFLVCGAAFAHHGSAYEFDSSKTVTLTGIVTEFRWANPHAQLFFDVTDSAGKITHWDCEMTSPAVLARNGWSKNKLKPGDKITITLHPAIAGASLGLFDKITFPDGSSFAAVNGGYPSSK